MALRRSCHPTQPAPLPAAQLAALPAAQLSTLPAPQQCTQMPQNRVEGPFSAICVHYCVTTGRPRGPRVATVYTNGPEQLREAVFANLCTLLRHHRPLARVPRCDSVHKWPKTAPRDRFRRSVYTIASPPGRSRNPRVATVYTNGLERRRKTVFANLCTLLHPHRPPARASRRNSVHNHEAPNIPALGRRTSPRSG